MSEMIQLENLPVETLAEMANEAAAACEASGRKTVEHAATCGRALLAAKAQVKHGEWLDWLAENFSQSQQRASQYMEIANYYTGSNLETAETIKGALRMIADSPEKQAKRAEREAKKLEAPPKPPASAPTPAAPATPAKLERPAWLADPDELERPEEGDLPPLPRTNTHHTSANRRTPDARETDRSGLVSPDDPRELQDGAWYVWSEDRNRLLPVTDEDVMRRFDQIRRERAPRAGQVMPVIPWPPKTTPVVEHAVTTTPVVDHKQDSVSSKPGKVPTVQQLTTAVGDRVHDGDWQDLWRGKLERAAESWARYKQSLTGKAKVRSMESWEAALTRIENVAHDRGVDAVCDMIEKAIANGWQGWEHEIGGSRGGSRISTAVRSNRNWDEEIPEWKPTE